MKRIKAINGYTIFELTQRDVDNNFYNATAGNYNIYLSSDIRDYGVSNSTPEYEDIETLKEALEICDGSTATALEIIDNSDYDYTIENIELIEDVINTARDNENYLIGIAFFNPYSDTETTDVICINYASLQAVIDDIIENEEVITEVTLRDKNGNITDF